jgi:hypothetical protein
LTWDQWRQIVDALGVPDSGDEIADQHFIEFDHRKAQCARWVL